MCHDCTFAASGLLGYQLGWGALMPHPKNADYQAELRRRRKEAGIVQVQVYVHESRREDIQPRRRRCRSRRHDRRSAGPCTDGAEPLRSTLDVPLPFRDSAAP